MKIAVIVVRVLMGLLFLFSSIAFFFKLFPVPELKGDMKEFNEGMTAAGYMLPFIKVIELICGFFFVSGFFVPLATVVIFPIVVNIFMVHLFLAPENLPVAVFLLVGNLFLAYYYRAKYTSLFDVK